MKKEVTNVAASVHARLLNRAKTEGRPFNEMLQHFAMERFLYRLSRSEHADRLCCSPWCTKTTACAMGIPE